MYLSDSTIDSLNPPEPQPDVAPRPQLGTGMPPSPFQLQGGAAQDFVSQQPYDPSPGEPPPSDPTFGPLAGGYRPYHAPGNIDLNNRPRVTNPDGSISTVRSISIDQDGSTYLIPTVIGDRVVSNDEAIRHFQQTGEHLGQFADGNAADTYAQQLHEQQAAMLNQYGPVGPNGPVPVPGAPWWQNMPSDYGQAVQQAQNQYDATGGPDMTQGGLSLPLGLSNTRFTDRTGLEQDYANTTKQNLFQSWTDPRQYQSGLTGNPIAEAASNPATYAFGLPMAGKVILGSGIGEAGAEGVRGLGGTQVQQDIARTVGNFSPFAPDLYHAGKSVVDAVRSGAVEDAIRPPTKGYAAGPEVPPEPGAAALPPQGVRASWATPVGERYKAAQDAIDAFDDTLVAKYGEDAVIHPEKYATPAELQHANALYDARDAIGTAEDTHALESVAARLSPEATSVVDAQGVRAVLKSIQDETEIYAHNGAPQPYATPQALARRIYQGLVDQGIKDGSAIDAFRGDPGEAQRLFDRGILGTSPKPFIDQAQAIVRDTLGGETPAVRQLSSPAAALPDAAAQVPRETSGIPPVEPPSPVSSAREPVERGRDGILDALNRKAEALHTPDNPILGPEGSTRRAVLAPIYNPSANMPREVHVANNARIGVQQELYGAFNRSEQDAARAVQSAFNADPPTYIGGVKNRVTNTAVDYLERPSVYTNVSPDLAAAKNQWQQAQIGNRDIARGQFNVNVGEYAQADPRGVYVPHVPSKEAADKAVNSVSASLAGKSGVAQTRGYDTLFERVQAHPEFVPETDLQLLADRHAQSLATLAGRETFKEGVGGLDKMQVLEETHPKLAEQVQNLRKEIAWAQGTKARLGSQITDALDAFAASPKEAADAAVLQDSLSTAREGITDPQITDYINRVRGQLRALQPALKSADTGDYVLNRDTFKYMKQPVSDAASSVLKTSVNNAFIEGAMSKADELRGIQLGPDFSPLSIQGVLGAMSHPEVPIQSGAGLAKVAFSRGALRDLADPELVRRYEFATGRSFGHAGAEFRQEGRGLERLPGVGRLIHEFNSGLERMVEYGTLKAWENDSNLLQKFGAPENIADHEAANSISKFVPHLNPAETGKSAQRARLERLPLISSSFRFAPISLGKDVATGVGKLAAHVGNPSQAWDSLTGREQLAVLRGASFASTWAALSVGSAIANAQVYGKDTADTVKSVLDPNSGRFGNILVGKSGGFGIGGPIRTTIRGLWPVSVTAKNGVEALPHVWNYARSSTANWLGTPVDLIRDKDYSGKAIYTGKTQAERIAQGIEYGLEQLNLTAGAAMADVRQGKPQNIPGDIASQLAGVNYYDTADSTPSGSRGSSGLPRIGGTSRSSLPRVR